MTRSAVRGERSCAPRSSLLRDVSTDMQYVVFDRDFDVFIRVDACQFDTYDERTVFGELFNPYGIEPALGPQDHRRRNISGHSSKKPSKNSCRLEVTSCLDL